MAPPRPMLGDVELQQVQKIEIVEDQVLAQHDVPALEGDFLQGLGRRATQVSLTGVLTGPEVGEGLKTLRDTFRAAEPVPFVADIATATRVEQVLIEEMGVRELAGKPERFEYAFTLREYTPAQEPEEERPPPPPVTPPPPSVETGTLIVEVIVEGEQSFDFNAVTVTVEGTEEDGTALSRTLTNRTAENVWEEQEFPPGEYTVTATVTEPQPMSGSEPGTVRAGQTERVNIILRPGQSIAKAFVIHFRFDSSFVEPCMRAVLRQVAGYAQTHPDEKLVVVGHTDLVGDNPPVPPLYNQSLSERRARSAFAYLTFGRDQAGALAEWDQLRRRRTRGVRRSLNDTWGTREYQYMLQDLGYYPGNIDGDHGPLTDAAVRAFQRDKGLAEDGIVGDDTWGALIEAYLSQDALAVPESQFLPNCEGEILKWLGCGEQDPVKNTRDAWRPNRRTELLFVRADALPCEVPEPDTFNLPTSGAVAGGWCLGPGNPDARCCFTTRQTAEQNRWLVQTAEPGTITVQGSITFEDGTPLANAEYVLIAPDGEYMDGERPRGDDRGRPIPGRTDADGKFAYPSKPKGIGVYTLELRGPYVVRLAGQPPEAAKGTVVCKRLDGTSDLDVTVTDRAVITVRPSITPATSTVVVKKPYTNPMRQPITLRADSAFTGSGTLNRSNEKVHFFTSAVGGTEISFDGTDNVFTDAQLAAGHTIYAEGATPSTALNDVQLTLTLTSGGQTGLSATATMTSVELTLDICMSRTAAGVDPAPLSANDKINPGRSVQAQTPGNDAERAMLIVRRAQPAAFTGELEFTPISARVRVFRDEVPAAGQVPLPTPHVIPNGTIPAGGERLWAEGVTASNAVRDTGFQLGIRNVEPDGDRVMATVIQLEVVAIPTANAPALTFVRVGLWDDAFDPATGNLRNTAQAADSFIDLDSRRLYFRVRDPSRANEIRIDWRTTFDDGTDDDAPPIPPFLQELSLAETGANTGVFVSRATMLVTDTTDRDEPVNSGMPAGHADSGGLPDDGDRTWGDSSHRKRMITIDDDHQLESQVRALYDCAPGINPFRVSLPVFERVPEERHRIRVHLVSVRDTAGGTGILTLLRELDVQDVFRAIYARCGIYAAVDVIELDPPASCTGWPTLYPGDPIAADPSVEESAFPGGVNLVPSTSQSDIINDVRALPGFNADDIYMICVARIYSSPLPAPPGPGLASAAGGESFPDSWTAAGSIARGFAFVALDSGITEFAEVHEATHITTDLRNVAGGHFDLGAAGAAAPGNIDGKNLMHRFFLPNNLGVSNPKRLWNRRFTNTNRVPNLQIPAQIDAIRNSRFVHSY